MKSRRPMPIAPSRRHAFWLVLMLLAASVATAASVAGAVGLPSLPAQRTSFARSSSTAQVTLALSTSPKPISAVWVSAETAAQTMSSPLSA